ncbi:MAG: acetyltransferase [Sulfuricaulis sp.]
MSELDMKRRIAEAVREACLKSARAAYENAGISGLCEEGRWECAVDAIRALDIETLIGAMPGKPGKR